jgi:hypothetical protein
MCQSHTLDIIAKADKKPETEWEIHHSIALRNSAIIQVSFANAVNDFRDKVSEKEISKALKRGDSDMLFDAVDWRGADFSVVDAKIIGTVGAGAKVSERFLYDKLRIPTIERTGIYLVGEQATENWISKYSGARVTHLNKQQHKVVVDAVRMQREKGLTTSRTAKLIKDNIGMNAPQMRAFANLEAKLTEQGKSPAFIEKKLKAYETKAIKYRAKMIAHTEAMDAVNEGMFETWMLGMDAGYYEYDQAYKRWFTTPWDKACLSCMSMQGQTRRIDQKFEDMTGHFDPVYRPTLHPWCACSMTIDILGF